MLWKKMIALAGVLGAVLGGLACGGVVYAAAVAGDSTVTEVKSGDDAEKKEKETSKTTSGGSFLGMVSWDSGLSDWNSKDAIKGNVVKIALNVLQDLVVLVSYLVIGYVCYGGYLYIMSSGDPGKAAQGKKTLMNALIGLTIALLSGIILNAIKAALGGGNQTNCLESSCVDGNTMFFSALSWAVGVAGVVAAIFVVIGAIGYITSAGDASKLQKSKNSIIYALIGLAIVGLAQFIIGFVRSTVENAAFEPIRNNDKIAIVKENYEEKNN